MDWDLEPGGAQVAAIALTFISSVLLVGFLFGWFRRARRVTSEPAVPDAIELHAAMVRLRGELPDLLCNISGRLDAKMRAMRELMVEAGETIAELRRLQSLRISDAGLSEAATDGCAPRSGDALRLGDLPSTALAPVDSRSTVARPDPAHELRFERYAHVYSLADAGLDAAAISAETGMHRGEVELVLNLRRKRTRSDRGSRSEPARVACPPEEASV